MNFRNCRSFTNKPFRKEWSDQHECMGWIVEQIERFDLHQKSCQSDLNWRRCEGFSFHFRWFSWLKKFNWPTLQEGAVCSWRLYGMNFRRDWGLELRRNRFRFAQEFMEIFRFFVTISPILLILRILTDQRFRKERSVHDACMGWI